MSHILNYSENQFYFLVLIINEGYSGQYFKAAWILINCEDYILYSKKIDKLPQRKKITVHLINSQSGH